MISRKCPCKTLFEHTVWWGGLINVTVFLVCCVLYSVTQESWCCFYRELEEKASWQFGVCTSPWVAALSSELPIWTMTTSQRPLSAGTQCTLILKSRKIWNELEMLCMLPYVINWMVIVKKLQMYKFSCRVWRAWFHINL